MSNAVYCGQRLRTIAEIALATGYVSADNSKYSRTTIRSWRANGFLAKGTDYFEEAVVGYYKEPMKFYDPKALDAAAKKQRAEQIRKRWTVSEEITKFGKTWARSSWVWRALGMSKRAFLHWKKRWSKKGKRWPILNKDHDQPDTIQHDGHTYFWKEQVEGEMKPNLANLPKKIPADNLDVYSLEKMSQLCGFHESKVRNVVFCRRHNLVTKPF
jgi:hypothetical protein